MVVPDGSTFSQAARILAASSPNSSAAIAYLVNRSQACWIQAAAIDWEQFSGLRHETWPKAIQAVGSVSALSIRRLREICRAMNEPSDSYYWLAGSDDGDWLTDLPYVRRCQGCRRFFYLADVRRTTCNVCRAKAERDKKRQQRGTDLSVRPCAQCGSSFTPKRSTARFCSTACRVAAHRAKASTTQADRPPTIRTRAGGRRSP